MAKIRIREIEAHLAGIQKIIDDCRTDIAAEKAAGGQDQPPTEPAMGGASVGEDSAPPATGGTMLASIFNSPEYQRVYRNDTHPGKGK